MAFPLAGIIIGAVSQVIKSKIGPKDKKVSLGEAMVGQAVTKLVTSTGSSQVTLIAGQRLGDLLERAIPHGRLENYAEDTVAEVLRIAANRLERAH